MSDLQRSFARAKLAQLPMEPPLPPMREADGSDETADQIGPLPTAHAEDDSSSASSASSVSSAGTIRPEPQKGRFARTRRSSGVPKGDLSPLPWTKFMAQELHLSAPASAFVYHAYITPPSSSTTPLYVFHHGAGASGLSFAACAAELLQAHPGAGVLAVDARGHGQTVPAEGAGDQERRTDGELDMSRQKLADDLVVILDLVKTQMHWSELPSLVLVGHSLGGAVVTRVAEQKRLGRKVQGLVVLDVVEGSAIDALQHMNNYLATRPSKFPSLENGIEWHVRSRTIRNPESARVSVPSYLTPLGDEKSDTDAASTQYTFRTPLASTSPHWDEWFQGLSAAFLAAPVDGRLLILAGTDRLDTALTIAQMQGRFQLSVIPDAGHFVHEDRPDSVAEVLATFGKRVGGVLVLPPKVGAQIPQTTTGSVSNATMWPPSAAKGAG